jgi:exonuclease VII large subunit
MSSIRDKEWRDSHYIGYCTEEVFKYIDELEAERAKAAGSLKAAQQELEMKGQYVQELDSAEEDMKLDVESLVVKAKEAVERVSKRDPKYATELLDVLTATGTAHLLGEDEQPPQPTQEQEPERDYPQSAQTIGRELRERAENAEKRVAHLERKFDSLICRDGCMYGKGDDCCPSNVRAYCAVVCRKDQPC